MRLLSFAVFLLAHVVPAAQPAPAEVEAFLLGAALDLRVVEAGEEEATGATLELLLDGTLAAVEDDFVAVFESGWRVFRADGATHLTIANLPDLRVESVADGRLVGRSTEGAESFALVETRRPTEAEREALRAALVGAWADTGQPQPLTMRLSADGALAQAGPYGEGSALWDLLPGLGYLLVYPTESASDAALVDQIYQDALGRAGEPTPLRNVHAIPVESVDAGHLRVRLRGPDGPVSTFERTGD